MAASCSLSLSRPRAAAQWIRDIGLVDLDTEWNETNRQPPFGIESVRLPAVPVKVLVHTNVTCAPGLHSRRLRDDHRGGGRLRPEQLGSTRSAHRHWLPPAPATRSTRRSCSPPRGSRDFPTGAHIEQAILDFLHVEDHVREPPAADAPGMSASRSSRGAGKGLLLSSDLRTEQVRGSNARSSEALTQGVKRLPCDLVFFLLHVSRFPPVRT